MANRAISKVKVIHNNNNQDINNNNLINNILNFLSSKEDSFKVDMDNNNDEAFYLIFRI